MAEALPDRVSNDPISPHYRADCGRIGIRFKGEEKTNVGEYCVSEGWVYVQSTVRGRDGKPIRIKLQGSVEPYWREA